MSRCEHCKEPFESRAHSGGEPQRHCSRYCKDRAWEDEHRAERQRRDTERKRARRRSQAGIDPIKNRARSAVAEALRTGRLIREPCEVGTSCRGRVEAHHDDYSKPLQVRWLCERHHGVEHRRKHAPAAVAA